MTPLTRLQWSKRGVTGYDATGFAFRIEDKHDVDFLNEVILEALKKIAIEAKKRSEYATQQIKVESGSESEHPNGDRGGQAAEASGRGSSERPAEGEEEVGGVPV